MFGLPGVADYGSIEHDGPFGRVYASPLWTLYTQDWSPKYMIVDMNAWSALSIARRAPSQGYLVALCTYMRAVNSMQPYICCRICEMTLLVPSVTIIILKCVSGVCHLCRVKFVSRVWLGAPTMISARLKKSLEDG